MKHCRILPRLPFARTLLKRRQRMQLRQMQIFPLACEDQRRTKGQCQRAASICIVWPLWKSVTIRSSKIIRKLCFLQFQHSPCPVCKLDCSSHIFNLLIILEGGGRSGGVPQVGFEWAADDLQFKSCTSTQRYNAFLHAFPTIIILYTYQYHWYSVAGSLSQVTPWGLHGECFRRYEVRQFDTSVASLWAKARRQTYLDVLSAGRGTVLASRHFRGDLCSASWAGASSAGVRIPRHFWSNPGVVNMKNDGKK